VFRFGERKPVEIRKVCSDVTSLPLLPMYTVLVSVGLGMFVVGVVGGVATPPAPPVLVDGGIVPVAGCDGVVGVPITPLPGLVGVVGVMGAGAAPPPPVFVGGVVGVVGVVVGVLGGVTGAV